MNAVKSAYDRGYEDGLRTQESRRHFEQTMFHKDDYSRGFTDGLKQFQKNQEVENEKSPAKSAVDAVLEKTQQDRIQIFENLMRDPGFVATFGDSPVVEFGDIEIWTTPYDTVEYDRLNEYRFNIQTSVTVKAQSSDYKDRFAARRVNRIKENRKKLEITLDQESRLRIIKELTDDEEDLLEHNLRLTAEGNLESV